MWNQAHRVSQKIALWHFTTGCSLFFNWSTIGSNFGCEYPQQVSEAQYLQNTDHPYLWIIRAVEHLSGLHGAYFHLTIHSQSRKPLSFHLQGTTYQFRALPFGLSTALRGLRTSQVWQGRKPPTQSRDIRIHYYLDNWPIRVKSHQICPWDHGRQDETNTT